MNFNGFNNCIVLFQEGQGYAGDQGAAPQIKVEPPNQDFNNMQQQQQPGWSTDKPTEKGDAGLSPAWALC